MIYFVQHIETGLIKIGCTGDVPGRLPSLASVYGAVKLLAFMPGESDDERGLHARFKDYNVRGILNGREWFAPVSALTDYIAVNCQSSDRIYQVARRVDKKVNKKFGLISTFPVALARKEERDGVRYTQKQISLATGISNVTMTRVFRGNIEGMNLATARKLCLWLDCEYEDLFRIVHPIPGVDVKDLYEVKQETA